MPAILNKCPLTAFSDGITSFIQYVFKTPEITPAEYRWSQDEKQTKMFISGPFTVTREKVGSLPTITVIRGPFNYENRTINNFKEANPNVFDEDKYIELLSGPLSIICEAGTGDEATSLAYFLQMELQANRLLMKKQMTFLHRLLWSGISQEQPVKEEAEIVRWQVTISLQATIYVGWLNKISGLDRFNKISVKNADSQWTSTYGETTSGSDLFVDNSADFGIVSTNSPQLLQAELLKKWYYISFDGSKMYKVEEIINSKTLKLSDVDADGNSIPYNPTDTANNLNYQLYWNTIHLAIELPRH